MTTTNEQRLFKKDCYKNAGLKKCFTALVDRKQVNLDMEVLNFMLKKELQINLESLDGNLAELLPLMLVMYMKTWPGWQRSKEYFSGKLAFKEWYEKFRQYIVLRLNFLIKNGYNNVVEEIKQERKNDMLRLCPNKKFVEHGTQTDHLAPRGFAPFSITIQCPPSVLNSVVFTDLEENIIIKQHPEITWTHIETKQLIHWPYTEIEFVSSVLSFKRKFVCEYERYINFINTPLKYTKSDFIEQVDIIDTSSGRKCYTLKLLKCFVTEYIKLLRSVTKFPSRNVALVEVVLNEFLQDIKEIDMNETMATNTSVLFNIGRCVFLRNKKITKGSERYSKGGSLTDVGYCEIIIPKMETSLIYFKDVQDTKTQEVTFEHLNLLKSILRVDNCAATLGSALPSITFRCNFCQVNFTSDLEILKHLEESHKMDPNVLCIKCKRSYTISYLTNMRWKHVCNNNAEIQQALQKQVPIVIK